MNLKSIGPARPEVTPVPKTWELPGSIRKRLGESAGSQRSICEDGHVLIILHHIPKADEIDRFPAFFWRKPDGDWRSTEGKGTSAVTLEAFVEDWEKRLHELDLEERRATTASQYHIVLEHAGPMLRAARGQHRALQQAREQMPDDRDLISVRDRAAANERTAELLLQDTQHGLDFIAAKQAEQHSDAAIQMTRTAHRLNVIAAIFLPLTAIASVLSMQLPSGLSSTPANFWLVLIAGSVFGAGVAVWATRRA